MTLVEFEIRLNTNAILGQVDGWASIINEEGILLGFNHGHEAKLRLPDYTESDVAFLRVQRKLSREYVPKYFGHMAELGNVPPHPQLDLYVLDCMNLPLHIRAQALAKTFRDIETAALLQEVEKRVNLRNLKSV
jgi:hypothetical protein